MYRFLDTKQSTINKKNNILIVNTFFQSFMLKVMNVYSILITDKTLSKLFSVFPKQKFSAKNVYFY